MLHSRPPSENFFPGTLWSRDIYVGDPYTFLFVKRGILQFVYVKPALAILTMALKATGHYSEGEISMSSSYLYLSFVYNISVSLTLWCLVVFFYAAKKDLITFRPLPKFLCVKAIIFFSFWQSVVLALLVATGIIQDDGPEHISVAIQDFLICVEMVPAAIAHSFAFSYEDYYDLDVHSARMPIFSAIKDSFGIKDVVMDTLDTFRGSRFNYRSFEPSEGVPHMGSSRTSRIMAGLRYSTSTAKKHWVGPAPTSMFIPNGRNRYEEVEETSEPLEFDDPDPLDDVEKYYQASRTMLFGDYNYPVIDFHIPIWMHTRRARSYGGTMANHYGSAGDMGESPRRKGKYREALVTSRGGCVDVIVEQGKGNFVLVEASSEDDTSSNPSLSSQLPSPLLAPQRTSKKGSKTPKTSVHVKNSLSKPSSPQIPPNLLSSKLLSPKVPPSETLLPPSPHRSPMKPVMSPSVSSGYPSHSTYLTPTKANEPYTTFQSKQTSPPLPLSSQSMTYQSQPKQAHETKTTSQWPSSLKKQSSNTLNDENDIFMTANVWK
ncbi:organic solute transporter Ostalpha-domain-containing protein [Spinellus fusiger]|nr:organic solute transporter Ostalpha-domain-containing protein [Spinellus fusiger]